MYRSEVIRFGNVGGQVTVPDGIDLELDLFEPPAFIRHLESEVPDGEGLCSQLRMGFLRG